MPATDLMSLLPWDVHVLKGWGGVRGRCLYASSDFSGLHCKHSNSLQVLVDPHPNRDCVTCLMIWWGPTPFSLAPIDHGQTTSFCHPAYSHIKHGILHKGTYTWSQEHARLDAFFLYNILDNQCSVTPCVVC